MVEAKLQQHAENQPSYKDLSHLLLVQQAYSLQQLVSYSKGKERTHFKLLKLKI